MPNRDDSNALRQLLAQKRNEIPSEAYFEGVLAEFHRRQRLQSSQSQTFTQGVLEAFRNPWFALRQVAAVLALTAVGVIAVNTSLTPATSTAEFAKVQTPAIDLAGEFAAPDLTVALESSTDDTLLAVDAAFGRPAFERVSFERVFEQPRYVHSPGAAATDTTVTF